MKIKGKFAKTYDRFVKRPSLLPSGLLELIQSTSSKTILELGCGTGTVAVGLAMSGFDIIGVDYSPEMLKAARKKAKENKTKVRFIQADITEASLKLNKKFDIILCLGNTLALIANHTMLNRFLANCQRHLNSGGYVIFQQLNYDRILKEKPATFAIDVDRDIFRFKQNRYFKNHIQSVVTIVDSSVIPPAQDITMFRVKPWTKVELTNSVKIAGFKKILFYGDYARNTFSLKSKDLIVFARA